MSSLAGEEAQERAAFAGRLIADGAAKHGVGGFQRIEDSGDGRRAWDVEHDFMTVDAGQGAEVRGEFDTDGHGRSLCP